MTLYSNSISPQTVTSYVNTNSNLLFEDDQKFFSYTGSLQAYGNISYSASLTCRHTALLQPPEDRVGADVGLHAVQEDEEPWRGGDRSQEMGLII